MKRKFLHVLERRLGWMAVPNITLYLMLGQILVYGLVTMNRLDPMQLVFVPALVLDGEIWRIVTFIFMPRMEHPILMAFVWYLFFIMGSALENHWGVFRYNLFLWVAIVATIGAAFAFPRDVATNFYILMLVYVAFAFVNPDFELMFLFILPIKVKWLSLIIWFIFAYALLFGPGPVRMMALASVGTFVLFFGREIFQVANARRRRLAFEAKRDAAASEPFHRCHTCGITDKSHPDMQFRYCSQCDGDYAYCEEHLRNHEHVKKGD